MDDFYTEEQRMILDAARDFAAERLAPHAAQWDRDGSLPDDVVAQMGELGLLGVTIPEAYGGSGLNYVSYGLVAREVERVNSGYRSMMSVQS